MSWLLFMDESGHDHKHMPYEVRGGVAIHDRRVWPFIRSVANLELDCFGVKLADFKKEFKGEKLLDKDRMKWAFQDPLQSDEERRRNARTFLSKGLQKLAPTRGEFSGYGQASFQMAQGIFRLLREHGSHIFASAIPRGVKTPTTFEAAEYLRKDHVFLFERFATFCESKQEQGLLIMDQVEQQHDLRFIRKVERYFVRTVKGTQRADWVVPSPLFTSSHLSIPVQVADVCIYALNWGYRRKGWGMDAPTRDDIEQNFSGWLKVLEFHPGIEKSRRNCSIVFIKNPYGSGEPT